MKIKALQAGGMLGYSIAEIPRARSSLDEPKLEKHSGGKKGDEEEKGILAKDLLEAVMANGLSNDVDVFVELLNKITQNSFSPKQAQQLLNKQVAEVVKIKLNKDALVKAVELAKAGKGLSEIAITQTGQIIVENQETGKLDQVSASQLKDNRDILRPVTNSELIHRRQTDPSLAYNTSIASVIGNGVGPEEISKYIFDIASKVGKSKQTSQGYVNTKEQAIDKGLQMLLDGGQDGVYKVETSTEGKGDLMGQALSYVYSVLPLNMKNFLRATAASQGLDPEKGASKLIYDMMTSTMSSDVSNKVAFDKDQTELANGGGSGDGAEKETIDLDQSALIVSGRGTPRDYTLNRGTSHTLTIDGEFYQAPDDLKGNPMNRSMTVETLLQLTKLAGVVNPGSVYIGDQKLSESEFKRVVYDNSGFLTTVLPYKTDAEGNKVVDYVALESIAQAKEEIAKQKNAAPIYKRQVYNDHGVLEFYEAMETEDAPINEKLLAPFLVFNGLTTDESDYGIKGIKSDKYTLIDNTKRATFDYAVDKDIYEGKGKVNTDSNWFGFGGGDIISGTVTIPITDDQISIYSRNKATKVPKSHGLVDRLLKNQAQNSKKQSLSNTSVTSLD